MVERLFRDLALNCLRRTIEDYDRHNQRSNPFIWTASASDVIKTVKRAGKSLFNVTICVTLHLSSVFIVRREA